MADILGQSTGGDLSVGGASFEDQTALDRRAMVDAHHRNVALGLLAAGLSTLAARNTGGRGQTMRAIGQGGLTGLSVYEGGEQELGREAAAQRRLQFERAKEADVQKYRAGELAVRGLGVKEQGRRTDIMSAGQKEKAAHDVAQEGLTQQQRDIAQQQADAATSRAGSEAARVGLEGTRVGIEQARVGIEEGKQQPLGAPTTTSLLKAYGVPNAEALGKAAAGLPRDLAMRAINTAVMAQKQGLKPAHYVDNKNNLHVYGVKPDGSKSFDNIIGPVQPKGKAKDTSLADQIRAATGEETPAVASAATPESSPTPSPASTPAPVAKMGVRLGAVDGGKYPDGSYRDPKSGRRIVVKAGVAYDADEAPTSPAPGGL